LPTAERTLGGSGSWALHQRVFVVGAEHLAVGGEVGQHFLGVRPAVDGKQNFHRGLLPAA
jgi:hypothetical protein